MHVASHAFTVPYGTDGCARDRSRCGHTVGQGLNGRSGGVQVRQFADQNLRTVHPTSLGHFDTKVHERNHIDAKVGGHHQFGQHELPSSSFPTQKQKTERFSTLPIGKNPMDARRQGAVPWDQKPAADPECPTSPLRQQPLDSNASTIAVASFPRQQKGPTASIPLRNIVPEVVSSRTVTRLGAAAKQKCTEQSFVVVETHRRHFCMLV